MKIKIFCERCGADLPLDYSGVPMPHIEFSLHNDGDFIPAVGYTLEGYLCKQCGDKYRILTMEFLDSDKKEKVS